MEEQANEWLAEVIAAYAPQFGRGITKKALQAIAALENALIPAKEDPE